MSDLPPKNGKMFFCRPVLDKGTSVITFTAAATATAAAAAAEMFPNADGYLSNCVETLRQYN